MVYLAIKELAMTAEDVIMVTASIMKDMQPNSEVIYRPNAIRALARSIDVSAEVGTHGKMSKAVTVFFYGSKPTTAKGWEPWIHINIRIERVRQVNDDSRCSHGWSQSQTSDLMRTS